MSSFADALDGLIPIVGGAAIDLAKGQIQELAEDADDPTKQLVLSLMAEAVSSLGADGLRIAEAEIERLLEGESVSLDWASPRTASDAVAFLQNAERGRKKKAKAALQKAGKVFGAIGAVFFQAAVKGALG